VEFFGSRSRGPGHTTAKAAEIVQQKALVEIFDGGVE
jgi:hypothetical protein